MAKKAKVTEVEKLPEYKNLPSPGVTVVEEEYPNSDEEDSYLSQSELSQNARWVSERLNDLLYKIHRNRFTVNEINKLRAQIENGVFVK